jgi:hypothetical protein
MGHLWTRNLIAEEDRQKILIRWAKGHDIYTPVHLGTHRLFESRTRWLVLRMKLFEYAASDYSDSENTIDIAGTVSASSAGTHNSMG